MIVNPLPLFHGLVLPEMETYLKVQISILIFHEKCPSYVMVVPYLYVNEEHHTVMKLLPMNIR